MKTVRFGLLFLSSLCVFSFCKKRAGSPSPSSLSPSQVTEAQTSSQTQNSSGLDLASEDFYAPIPPRASGIKPSDLKPLNPKATIENGQLQVVLDEDPNRAFAEGFFCKALTSDQTSCTETHAPETLISNTTLLPLPTEDAGFFVLRSCLRDENSDPLCQDTYEHVALGNRGDLPKNQGFLLAMHSEELQARDLCHGMFEKLSQYQATGQQQKGETLIQNLKNFGEDPICQMVVDGAVQSPDSQQGLGLAESYKDARKNLGISFLTMGSVMVLTTLYLTRYAKVQGEKTLAGLEKQLTEAKDAVQRAEQELQDLNEEDSEKQRKVDKQTAKLAKAKADLAVFEVTVEAQRSRLKERLTELSQEQDMGKRVQKVQDFFVHDTSGVFGPDKAPWFIKPQLSEEEGRAIQDYEKNLRSQSRLQNALRDAELAVSQKKTQLRNQAMKLTDASEALKDFAGSIQPLKTIPKLSALSGSYDSRIAALLGNSKWYEFPFGQIRAQAEQAGLSSTETEKLVTYATNRAQPMVLNSETERLLLKYLQNQGDEAAQRKVLDDYAATEKTAVVEAQAKVNQVRESINLATKTVEALLQKPIIDESVLEEAQKSLKDDLTRAQSPLKRVKGAQKEIKGNIALKEIEVQERINKVQDLEAAQSHARTAASKSVTSTALTGGITAVAALTVGSVLTGMYSLQGDSGFQTLLNSLNEDLNAIQDHLDKRDKLAPYLDLAL